MDLCCHTGLAPNVLGKEVFERELALCKKLYQENNGSCHWGECEHCGVIPLLYKLHKGVLLEDQSTVEKTKKNELA
jgi:hypothetical protein